MLLDRGRPVGVPPLVSDIEELRMPHMTLYALEEELTGREPGLIRELTSAVVSAYGEWARRSVEVRLIGIPAGRWARGGAAVAAAAPAVTFRMCEEVVAREDAARSSHNSSPCSPKPSPRCSATIVATTFSSN
jgi:phenylpyruvate tautomerase PptA (4-oxalocrotonate tautomerase family)